MSKYHLTVFKQSRIYLGLFLFPVGLIGFFILGVEFGNLILGIFLLIGFIAMFRYFIIGHLTVTLDKSELQFEWEKKYFFNYKDIEPIKLSDIETIVLDSGQLLRKIKTLDRTVYINNSKIKPKDAPKFICALSSATKNYNFKTIDSWGEFAEKGYLNAAFWTTTIILILATTIVGVFIALKGFRSVHLILILAWLPQMVLYRQQMKQKLKNKESQT